MVPLVANAVLAALALLLSGCGEAPGSSPSAQPVASTAGSAPPTIAATASASSSAPASGPASPLAGAWRGTFDAKKATVTLDMGVKEPTWSADDGKAHAGKGEVELQVAADGTIKGSLRGSLGNATVAGTAEGDTLTMTFAPKESGDSEAISGVIALKLENAKLSGDLNASSGDATIVRTAKLELTRGTP